MSPRPLLVSLIALLTFTPAAFAQSAPEAKSPPPQTDETELAKAMSTLNSAWRKLRRQVADPASNASSLELVATIKNASVKSAEFAPDLAKDQPESERAKFVATYQARMKEFIAELDKLAAAFKANDNAAADALVKKLGTLQREGHKEFRRPESK